MYFHKQTNKKANPPPKKKRDNLHSPIQSDYHPLFSPVLFLFCLPPLDEAPIVATDPDRN